MVLVEKWLWRLLNEKNTLLVGVEEAKYGKNEELSSNEVSTRGS